MSQVPAITNETSKTPEPSDIQRNDDNFLEILEKEKTKIILPSMLPVNFQSFFNIPTLSGNITDTSASKNDNFHAVSSILRQDPLGSNKSEASPVNKDQEQTQPLKADGTSKAAQAEQVKFTANAVNRIFAGEIDLSPDLYAAAINAKNRIASLRGVDVDDIIAQIKDKINFLINGGGKELSVELKPESLGTILMNVSSNKGVISVNIYAEQAAKQALDENIAELKRSLKLANLNIEYFNVISSDKKEHNKGKTG